MKRINIFAKKGDLLLFLDKMQAKKSLKFTRLGKIDALEPEIWSDARALPNLGRATGDQSIVCDSFMILEHRSLVHVKPLVQRFEGNLRFDVEQNANPDSILLNPGGEWIDGSLIAGFVSTISESPVSQALMRSAHSAIKSFFTRVNAFWVGPEALIELRSGKRLCYAIQSPRQFDLRETTDASTQCHPGAKRS